jgi:hypothetical protein
MFFISILHYACLAQDRSRLHVLNYNFDKYFWKREGEKVGY